MDIYLFGFCSLVTIVYVFRLLLLYFIVVCIARYRIHDSVADGYVPFSMRQPNK